MLLGTGSQTLKCLLGCRLPIFQCGLQPSRENSSGIRKYYSHLRDCTNFARAVALLHNTISNIGGRAGEETAQGPGRKSRPFLFPHHSQRFFIVSQLGKTGISHARDDRRLGEAIDCQGHHHGRIVQDPIEHGAGENHLAVLKRLY